MTGIKNYRVELPVLKVLELVIDPDMADQRVFATLERMQVG